MTTNRSTNLPFPQDIMIEILNRIPFKSVLTCKRVAKQWKNLINDPVFYKRYPHHNTKTHTSFFLGKKTLYTLFTTNDVVHPIPIELENMSTRYSNYDHQLLNSGSSNGIVCAKSSNGIFYFHNLFNGESFVVADAPMRRYSESWLCYGFGYDRELDDNKIFIVNRKDQNSDNSLFWVYSLKNPGWKKLEGFPYYNALYDRSGDQASRACSINGVLHWLVVRRYKKVIVTYDLHTGRFGEMSVPKINDVYYDDSLDVANLAELNGRLCYVYKKECSIDDVRCTNSCDVWVMKEYGFTESWEELLSIDCSSISEIESRGFFYDDIDLPWVWDCITPAAILESGEHGRKLVLFVCNYYGTFFWYDIDQKKVLRVMTDTDWQKIRKQCSFGSLLG